MERLQTIRSHVQTAKTVSPEQYSQVKAVLSRDTLNLLRTGSDSKTL